MKIKILGTVAMAAAAAIVFAGCSGGASDGGSDGTGPIKIGFSAPLTGSLAESGQDMLTGANAAVKEINDAGGVNGRMIELVVQDEQGTADTAVNGIRNLSSQGLQLVAGVFSSTGCLAIVPQLESLDMMLVGGSCVDDSLGGQNGQATAFKNFFRVANPNGTTVPALVDVLAKKFPDVTNYSAFVYDYVTGHNQWNQFNEDMQAQGVQTQTASETFVPISETNYSLQVQSMMSQVGDPATSGLYLGTFGAGTGALLKQAASYDLNSKFAVIAAPGGYYTVARTLGGTAPNVWNSYDYNYAAYDNALNKQFIDDVQVTAKKLPDSWTYNGYLTIQAYAAAIKKAGSTDLQPVLDAMAGVTFDSPSGELTMNATTHQLNNPIVVTNTVGDPSAPEGVKILDTIIVPTD